MRLLLILPYAWLYEHARLWTLDAASPWTWLLGFVAAALGRFGALDILLQHERPAPALQANWLPTPAGKFNLFLRTYLPGPGVLTVWNPPSGPGVRLDAGHSRETFAVAIESNNWEDPTSGVEVFPNINPTTVAAVSFVVPN